MRSYWTLSLQDVYISILHGAAKFYPIHFANIVSHVGAKFQTRLRIFNRMICLKRDYTLRLRFTSTLYVHCMCSVNEYNVLHNITEKSSTFFSSSMHTHAHTKREIHMSCLLYFVSFFPSFFSLTFFHLWHIEQVKRVAIVVDILRIPLFTSYFLYSSFSQDQCTFYTWQNLQEFEIISALLSTFLLFIPILPWICHINSPHMPDTWLHLLMSDHGNVHTANIPSLIYLSIYSIDVKVKLFPHILLSHILLSLFLALSVSHNVHLGN